MSARPLVACLVAREEPGLTGTSRYADQLAEGLRSLGIDTIPRSTRPAGRLGRTVGLVDRLGLGGSAFLATYPLWMHWPLASVYHLTVQTYASVLRLARPTGPVVVTVHDIGPYLFRGDRDVAGYRHPAHALIDALSVRMLHRADAIIVPSHWTRATLIDVARIPDDRIVVVPLGVDHERFRPAPVPRKFREQFTLPESRPYVLAVGSDEPRKNLPTLLRAMASVRRHLPDAMLLKVGTGFDPRARATLLDLTKQLGLAGAVRFHDRVSDADLARFYNAATVFVMPSLYEGFGLPVLEAMASGIPVIALDRTAMPEVLVERAPRVADPFDSDGLADAIVRVLQDHEFARDVAAAGRARADAFTWAATVARTVDVYRGVAGLPTRMQASPESGGQGSRE